MAGPGGKDSRTVQPRLRLDKWLFCARFFVSRDLAVAVIEEGHLRINAQRCTKPGHGIGVGDVLTFAQGARIRVIRITALSVRRGPPGAAQELYVDLDASVISAPLE